MKQLLKEGTGLGLLGEGNPGPPHPAVGSAVPWSGSFREKLCQTPSLERRRALGGAGTRGCELMPAGTGAAGVAPACREAGTRVGTPVLGVPAPCPRAGAVLTLRSPHPPASVPARRQQRLPPRGQGSPCVVVDGRSQGIPGAPRQDAQRLLHGVLPVRPLHEPVHHLWGRRELVAPRDGQGTQWPLPSPGRAEPPVPPARAAPRPRLLRAPSRLRRSPQSHLKLRSCPRQPLLPALCPSRPGLCPVVPLTSYSSPSPDMTTSVSHCDRSSSRTFS